MKPRLSQVRPEGTAGTYPKVNPTGDGWTYDTPSGAAAALDDLTDVDTTTTPPANGDALAFDSASGLWVPSAISGGGSLTVEDEGVALTVRSTIDFQGAGVTATDDAVNSKTVVTIPGGGGSGGAFAYNTPVTKTSAYTAVAGDFVLADATTAGFTVTLPTSPTAGSIVTVVKPDTTANAVTIAPPSGGRIDNLTSARLTKAYDSLTLVYVGSSNWVVSSAVGSPTYSKPPLSVIVSGTYGDDFAGASLDPKWTRVGFLASEETYQQGGGDWMYWAGSRAAGSYYYQAAPSGDFEVIWAGKATVSGGAMVGALILDASGNGIAGVFYNSSPDGSFIATVSAGSYGGSFNGTGAPTGTTFYGSTQPEVWFRLKKVGTTYTFYTSTDGSSWGSVIGTLTSSITPARIGMGCIFGTVTSLKSDVFDVR